LAVVFAARILVVPERFLAAALFAVARLAGDFFAVAFFLAAVGFRAAAFLEVAFPGAARFDVFFAARFLPAGELPGRRSPVAALTFDSKLSTRLASRSIVLRKSFISSVVNVRRSCTALLTRSLTPAAASAWR
jgi:hypothetical protein